MPRKTENNRLLWLFINSAAFIASTIYLMRPPANAFEEPEEIKLMQADTTPTVWVREDSCRMLVKYFCDKYGGIQFSQRSSVKNYKVEIYNFGANKEIFYNKNKELVKLTDQSFRIETRMDTLAATFARKDINGVSCVQLPTDILYALMMQHPLTKLYEH
jgi:hypothetical protein